MGRPSKYTPEVVTTITTALREGDTRRAACIKAGISDETFSNWMQDNLDFLKAVNEAEAEYHKWEANELLSACKQSLKKLILGGEYTETVSEFVPDKNGIPQQKKMTKRTKQVPPNATAIIFALCNRDPENWRQRVEADIKGQVQTEESKKIDLSDLSDEVLEQIAQKIYGD